MSKAHALPLSLQADLAQSIFAQMERILAHRLFARSPRLCQLFRYAVKTSVEGRSHCLKEYTIAVDVFGRPETFDCRLDSIVRVEAARLRNKLDHYYRTDGLEDRIVLKLPPSGYEPVLSFRETQKPLRPGIPVIAVVESEHSAGPWSKSLEGGLANVVRISRDSLERFHGRFDLMVVLVGEGGKPSDYAWVLDKAARCSGALLFVDDSEGEVALLALGKTLREVARDAVARALQSSSLTARPPRPARQPVPIDSVA